MASPTHDPKARLLAKQNPHIGEFVWRQLSQAQRQLWQELGGAGLTIASLEERLPNIGIVNEIYALQALGAIVLEDLPTMATLVRPPPAPRSARGTAPGPAQAARHGLPNPSPREQELLELSVGLSSREKVRILQIARGVDSGDFRSVLGLGKEAGRKELKRAYFELSKELHPDRYFNRELGPFSHILSQAFGALSQYVKALGDKRTMLPDSYRANNRSRRKSKRFGIHLRAKAQCGSWNIPEWTVSEDISNGGVFLVTDAPAYLGESIKLMLDAPAGPIGLSGTVVSIRDADQARRLRRRNGIGISFSEGTELSKASLDTLLKEARKSAPRFATSNSDPAPTRQRMARGSAVIHNRDPIVGIDLGTTNTAVSAVVDNRVRVLPWPNGAYSMPSVVGFPVKGRCIVGYEAQKLLLASPQHVINSGKRLVGRQIDDSTIASYMAEARFPHEKGPDGSVIAKFWGEQYAIPQICSYLFSAAAHSASRALGTKVSKAVLTVPVSFDDTQLRSMRRSAQLAGLDVIEIIEEPCAAALANQGQQDFEGIVGVYDFGGGTFDFSLVEAGAGDMRVLATTGDSWLGGDDFDLALADAAANMFWQSQGVDLRLRAVEWQYLVHASEQAKRTLSKQERTQIVIPEAMRTKDGPIDLRIGLARQKVEMLWAGAIRRSIDTCTQALSLAGVSKSQLSGIFLSGGTSYIPAIHRSLGQRFGVPVHLGLAPEHAVCAGAGVRAAALQGTQGKHAASRSYSL
jgi:actin-like ATPase involved in cell morphogenesis/Tfp pilus assembly protein PilZ